jgi:3-phenylpropionate/trans-cinnamate dioxygenase ferredoxin component
MTEKSWQRVAGSSEVAEGEVFGTQLGDKPIALCRFDGKVYAFDDVCPHAYALLSQGFVEGNEIECPLHGARFEIATGKCVAPPADSDLKMHDVRIDGDDIYVSAEEK